MKRLDFIKSLGLLPAAFMLPKAVSGEVGEGHVKKPNFKTIP